MPVAEKFHTPAMRTIHDLEQGLNITADQVIKTLI